MAVVGAGGQCARDGNGDADLLGLPTAELPGGVVHGEANPRPGSRTGELIVEDAARWQKFVDIFNVDYPNIKVNLIGVPGDNWSGYLNGTATLIAGGEQPDIIWVATEGVRLLVSLGLLRPFDDLMERDSADLGDFFDDVDPKLLDSFKQTVAFFDEKLKGSK